VRNTQETLTSIALRLLLGISLTKKQNQHKAGLFAAASASSSYDGKVETVHVGGKNLPATISTRKLLQTEEAVKVFNLVSWHCRQPWIH